MLAMISVDDDYTREVECDYRNEHYSVRDNGSVMRHGKLYGTKRKLDWIWTFGKVNAQGYLQLRSEMVHRIVATAYHGIPPSDDYVVDHIDTNRQNNRPTNLRWLTRLENILNNPITLSKIIFCCGSIDEFLKNPSVMCRESSDYSWMRTVTAEEAKNALDNLMRLSDLSLGGKERYDAWVSHKLKPRLLDIIQSNQLSSIHIKSHSEYGSRYGFEFPRFVYRLENSGFEGLRYFSDSNNANALQCSWGTECKFLLCPPNYGATLKDYYDELEMDSVFLSREYGGYCIVEYGYNRDIDVIFVACKISLEYEGMLKDIWDIVAIGFHEGKYLHKRFGHYFSKKSVDEAMGVASKFTQDSWVFKKRNPRLH